MKTVLWGLCGCAWVLSAVVACGGDGAGRATEGNTGGKVPGTGGAGGGQAGGSGGVGAAVSESFAALAAKAEAAKAMTPGEVASAYPTAFQALDYDPLTATYLDKIQASSLALSEAEKGALGKNGFAISTSRQFPTFVYGYAQIYSEHLPVYVSADAILETVHNGYDAILLSFERAKLIPDVRALLEGMHQRLAASTAPDAVRADVDVYLTVARSLLNGVQVPRVANGDNQKIATLVRKAREATGIAGIELFGKIRNEDFSQFEPRGHYADEPELQQYFRAMIWLGRVDFRIIETTPDGQQVFNRPQYDATLLMGDLLRPDMERWRRIDGALATFVGQSDNMVAPEIEKLVADLGGGDAARSASNEAVTRAFVDGGYGQQQIASYLMVNLTNAPLPLNRSFLLLGQRYIVDSHVFSGVVYDRMQSRRMMPSPLDAAFGALANNQALALNPDIGTFEELPGALARLRVLVDSKDAAFWESSFYNLWLGALRALSPAADAASLPAGLPRVATTEAWGRRLLNTQLGSWAELRHDTLLYAKQSYTGIPGCDFPDAYVDPYPQVFGAIRRYAEQGGRLAQLAEGSNPPQLAEKITAYFENLRSATTQLEQIAQGELEGKALTAEQLAFINDAVRIEKVDAICTTIEVADGWLAKLYFDVEDALEFDPTIADVHTQPADESGNIVGKVLHVGTGYPRLMVATTTSCGQAPRAYAGVVFAYHEQVTNDFARLTDQEWKSRFAGSSQPRGAGPADVPWLLPVLGR